MVRRYMKDKYGKKQNYCSKMGKYMVVVKMGK